MYVPWLKVLVVGAAVYPRVKLRLVTAVAVTSMMPLISTLVADPAAALAAVTVTGVYGVLTKLLIMLAEATVDATAAVVLTTS